MPVYKQGPTGPIEMRLTKKEANAYNRVIQSHRAPGTIIVTVHDQRMHTYVAMLFRQYVKIANISITPAQMVSELIEA